MIAVIQRVESASVKVDEQVTGQIKAGLLLLLCVVKDDTEQDATMLLNKIVHLRFCCEIY